MPGLRDGLYPGLYQDYWLAKRGGAGCLCIPAQPMVDAFTAYNY